jgi:hypothetical protein
VGGCLIWGFVGFEEGYNFTFSPNSIDDVVLG